MNLDSEAQSPRGFIGLAASVDAGELSFALLCVNDAQGTRAGTRYRKIMWQPSTTQRLCRAAQSEVPQLRVHQRAKMSRMNPTALCPGCKPRSPHGLRGPCTVVRQSEIVNDPKKSLHQRLCR